MNATDQAASRADELYARYMGHLYGCAPCQRENYCPVGNRMRAAWKCAQSAAMQTYRARTERRQ
ncbi:hypothetical protein [Streptomyces flavofungini]|uniref:hypothetical protein n=1 Tax=Streptomyces flavofungini TaxID=68200 RepID=UPI0025AF35C3|nr:hypothetical protein [Streptomyces flavofungini]WJV51821.1 hypothetical protein QUY26_40650 [Streptomyces flavofungini]WJV51830.1 hypothetical protein QUY26_40695 [Streptomyces flavofungini]